MKRKSKFPLMETFQSKCARMRAGAFAEEERAGPRELQLGYASGRWCMSLSSTQSSVLASFLRTLVLDALRPKTSGLQSPSRTSCLGFMLSWYSAGEQVERGSLS